MSAEPAAGPRVPGGVRGLLCHLSRARPEELPAVLALFGYNFLVITSYLILKPARYSLFLDRLGPSRLPWAYIGTALFVGLAVWAYERLLDHLSRTGVVITTWIALSGALLAFRAAFLETEGVAVSALFYFFSAVYGVVGVTLFWSFTAEVVDPPQGRRLFGFLQAGAILGGLAGSAFASALATRMGTENLLLASALLCVVCAAVGGALSRAYPRPHPPEGPEAAGASLERVLGGAQLVRRSRYLRGVAALLLGFQLVSTLADYLFQTVVFEAYPAKDLRTAFFGSFYFWVGVGGLGVQVCLTPRIHRRLGVGAGLVVLPLLSAVGVVGFLAAPGLTAGCAFRGVFGMLDYSLDRATRELLYLPTTPAVKTRAKAFLDMFCFRLFRSLGGVLILILGKGEQASLMAAAALTGGAAIGWWASARVLARAYVREVRTALLGAPEPAPPPAHEISRARWDTAVAELVAEVGGDEEEAARARMVELTTRRFGGDVPAALAALEDPERRPLAQELLDGITPPGEARLVVRVLDRGRREEQRASLAARLGARLPTDAGRAPRG